MPTTRQSEPSIRQLRSARHDANNMLQPLIILCELHLQRKLREGPLREGSRERELQSTLDQLRADVKLMSCGIPEDNPAGAVRQVCRGASLARQHADVLVRSLPHLSLPPELDSRHLIRKSASVLELLGEIARNNFRTTPLLNPVDLNHLLRGEASSGLAFERVPESVALDLRAVGAQKKGSRQPTAMVHADEGMLHRVVSNLFSDASIHPEFTGPVRLKISTYPRKDGLVGMRVVSAGAKPIPGELIPLIGYREFTTRQQRDGVPSTHGHGKISVREIVEAHGGSFKARNFHGQPALEIALPAFVQARRGQSR